MTLSATGNLDAGGTAQAFNDLTRYTGGGQIILTADNGNVTLGTAGNSVTFGKAGYNSGGTSTLERYASDLAGQVGNLASNAKTNQDSTAALLTEATARRTSYEGVNLDEELVNLTTYQQGYSAAGRLVQAAKDMYDTLLNMI